MELEYRETEYQLPASLVDPKAYGAYYTNGPIADFLVWWAIRDSNDRIIDPSFGGGIFLSAASERIRFLGGSPSQNVFGVEIDEDVHRSVATALHTRFDIPLTNFTRSDFFDFQPGSNGFDAVIGNPPFIRYQRFDPSSRKRALDRAAALGVRLTRLSSSWAPFLVMAGALVKPGGRLGFVLPVELTHASYAAPVLEHLAQTFGKVTLLTFKRKLFPDLNEDTLLLLASNKGSSTDRILHRDLSSATELKTIQKTGRTELYRTRALAVDDVLAGKIRLVERILPNAARELYQRLKSSEQCTTLGQLADVGIGYVTGANDYFHLTREKAQTLGIPHDFLLPALRRTRSLQGLRFSFDDWADHIGGEDAEYLFYVSKDAPLPESVDAYVKFGEASGVSKTYKCRSRKPWYAVPHVRRADAFLTYMSGFAPRLVVNESRAVVPNTLHVVRMHKTASISPLELAVLWTTSLTKLSAEIQGHSLGGGMLKIEPREAESCLVANPADTKILTELAVELDYMIRRGETAAAQLRADQVILGDLLGLRESEWRLLAKAATILRKRRYQR